MHLRDWLFLWMALANALPSVESRGLTCVLEVPIVCRGEVRGLLALDAAGSEDQAALVADHEAVLAALALGLGRPPQQAAVAAPLQRGRTEESDTPPRPLYPSRAHAPPVPTLPGLLDAC